MRLLRLTSLAASLFFTSLALSPSSSNASVEKRQGKCRNPTVRKDWFALTDQERASYIDATKCLKTKPPVSGLPDARSLFDDFAAVHITLADEIHNVAAMIPWHCGFTQARENALRSCGFTGPMPYWDFRPASDRNDPFHDRIFDDQTGVGGNGDPDAGWAVTGGPFANFTVNLRASEDTNVEWSPHLMRRNFQSDDEYSTNATAIGASHVRTTSYMKRVIVGAPSYQKLHQRIESSHGSAHDFISGEMRPHGSPQDLIFFLLHVAIDMYWRQWQDAHPDLRYDYHGNRPDADEFEGPFYAQSSDRLRYMNLMPDMTVRDVMDPQGSVLCYRYE